MRETRRTWVFEAEKYMDALLRCELVVDGGHIEHEYKEIFPERGTYEIEIVVRQLSERGL